MANASTMADVVRDIRAIQQNFAESSGYKREIIWDLLSEKQADVLMKKIKQLVPDQKKEQIVPDQRNEQIVPDQGKEQIVPDQGKEQTEQVDISSDQEKAQRRVESLRNLLFSKVWEQRKYTNRNSLSAIIYVLVRGKDVKELNKSDGFSCHPVFRTRKCIDENDSSSCCMIFIDEEGRVYQNWKSYLNDNTLPEGVLYAPKNGVYMFDDNNKVMLDVAETPASSLRTKVLATADTTTAVAGFCSALVPIAAVLSLPVAAPIIAGATAIGLTSAGYTTFRSATNLYDRGQHEQSVSLANRQARNSWLGMAAGLVGLGASGATHAMTAAAAAGKEISVVTQLFVNGMNISTIVLSGTGVANGTLDLILKYRDDEEVTWLDGAQLAASLFLFTHSVYNFRMASKIINDTRNKTIQSMRKNLSNRQRRMFDKMSKETIRIRGETLGKMDILRNVNDIPSKQFLNDLYKVNKELNKQNIRPSFGSAGEGVVLNNEMRVDTQVLRNNLDMLGKVTQPIPASYQDSTGLGNGNVSARAAQYSRILFDSRGSITATSDNLVSSTLSAGVRALSISSIVLLDGAIVVLTDFGKDIFENILNAESFEDVMTTMGNLFSENAFRFLMNTAKKFVECMLENLRTVLKMFISSESILYRILDYCMSHYSNRTYEYLREKELEILVALRDYFMSLNPNAFKDLLQKCKECSGYFAISKL